MTEFLPDGYEVPQSEGKFFKLKIGENKFRILTSAIIGFVGWDHSDKEKPKPIRKKTIDEFVIDEIDPESLKHFWAFFVWNPKAKKIQVLQITQKSIMKSIKSLTSDEDWGDPLTYDMSIDAIGEGLEREYNVNPKPKAELPVEAIAEWDAIKDKVDLEKMYIGEDPFCDNDKEDKK